MFFYYCKIADCIGIDTPPVNSFYKPFLGHKGLFYDISEVWSFQREGSLSICFSTVSMHQSESGETFLCGFGHDFLDLDPIERIHLLVL